MTRHLLVPDWNGNSTILRKTWRPIGNIDQFRWLSRADVHEHLRMARDELGVRYVRACAMYSPELRVWDYDLPDWRIEASQKQKHANWQMIDINLEALLALGLKPIYTTCFTPVGMNDDTEHVCWPDRNPVSLPLDLAQWQKFVAEGLCHHIERYGIDEVRSWYFECWNEPNLDGFFNGTQEEFFRLWSATWHAVKSVDSQLRFGGPSTARGEWIESFLDFTARDSTPPDYLITHVYNNDSESEPLSPFDGPASYKVKDSPHFASGVIRGLRKLLDARDYKGEVHWNEWGRSWFPHDPLKETALEAAFVVKTMAQSSQHADAFAFWCLSDIYDQCGFQSSEFQANYGMLSLHGLRKPAWIAHVLLNRLGSKQVAVDGGDEFLGVLATRHGDSGKMLVYSYPQNHDAAPEKIEVSVPWPFGKPTLIRLGAEENNIVAKWKTMGAPAYPSPTQISQLRAGNVLSIAPSEAIRIEQTSRGNMVVFEMECPGVAILES